LVLKQFRKFIQFLGFARQQNVCRVLVQRYHAKLKN
jgi:hypothetical protein